MNLTPMEKITTGVGTAFVSKEILTKMLGPTADYLGEELLGFVKKCNINIGDVFNNAIRKLGKKLDEPGQVNSKVLKEILISASFCENKIAKEYLGGVLASSRTEDGRDDRGASFVKIVDQLSSYQLRTHYLIYSAVKKLFCNSMLRFVPGQRERMRIFIPYSSYKKAMDYNENEFEQKYEILQHVIWGLDNENLIYRNEWRYGHSMWLSKHYTGIERGGIVCMPSNLGVQLFLSAFGYLNKNEGFFFDKSFESNIEGINFNDLEMIITTKKDNEG